MKPFSVGATEKDKRGEETVRALWVMANDEQSGIDAARELAPNAILTKFALQGHVGIWGSERPILHDCHGRLPE
jgi:hypothetical protein